MRRGILDAARELFVNEGYHNVSIRKVAERIEYSPAAIYLYFPSKDDIFFALAEEGFRLLGDPSDLVNHERFATQAPLDRIRAIFWRVYEFSVEHPQYFALMFVDRSVPRITREYERFTFVRDMKSHIVEQIQVCIDATVFPATLDPTVACRLLIMAVLGVATMRLSDRLARAENADELARDVLNVMLAGLQTGIPLQSTVVECAIDETAPSAARVS
ncbi:MAG: TetR/AcrR family transcriptional regulator [Acidobacteriota bacterium]